MINKIFEKFYTSRTVRFICLFIVTLCLSACEDDNSSAAAGANYNSQAKCWQNGILKASLKVIDSLYSKTSGAVSGIGKDSGAAVICVGFAIWLAFKLLKVLPSFKEENLGEVWTEIGQKLFVCAFCATVVSSNLNWAMQVFVVPIYNTILELGAEVVGASKAGASGDLGAYGSTAYSHNPNACKSSGVTITSLKGSILPMASCLTCSISDRLNSGIRIGTFLMGTGRLSAILVGIVMLLTFSLAKFGFVLFVLDSLFRLNFAVFLLPILACGVPFNYTRKWCKSGLLMFLNSSGIMLFIGLLVCIAIGALEYIINAIGPQFKEENIEGLGPMMLAMALIAVLLINIPGMGVALADKFIGGGGSLEFQKKVSKFVLKAAKSGAAFVLGAVTGGATSAVTGTMEKYEATREILETAKQKKDQIMNTVNQLAGYNND